MDAKKILDALRKGADFVEAVAPVAIAIGGPLVATVVGTISTVRKIGDNLETLVNEGKVVFSDAEASEVAVILNRIAAANDALNKAIEQS